MLANPTASTNRATEPKHPTERETHSKIDEAQGRAGTSSAPGGGWTSLMSGPVAGCLHTRPAAVARQGPSPGLTWQPPDPLHTRGELVGLSPLRSRWRRLSQIQR
ncbi:hypothetical protein DAI22_07g091350 [Oryza sativa Japonica Group]|nr:hypothetical protein DAI22_07g091350 [Oryza sativa Japonica Group]